MSGIFHSVGNFINRNRKKVIFTGGLFGGIYLIGRFAKSKLIELQETMALDQITRENIKKRFQRNQYDCLTTTSNFLPSLLEDVSAMYNVEMLTARLQHTKNSNQQQNVPENTEQDIEKQQKLEKKTKIELWEELKIMSFTRLIASIYIVNLISLLSYIQINLIGRYVYMDSVLLLNHGKNDTESNQSSNSETKKEVSSNSLSSEIQGKYLAFCYHLLHVGWKDLAEEINEIIESEIGPISLKSKINYESLIEIIKKIRNKLESINANNRWNRLNLSKYIINSEEKDNEVLAFVTGDDKVVIDGKLKDLLSETRDILDSNDFSMVLESCLNESFENLYLILKPTFIDSQQQQQQQQQPQQILEEPIIPTKEIPLALILPIITKSIYSVFYGVPNHFLNIIKDNIMQQRFSAIIYSSFEID